jgi:multimeric flavodoxin WrbA
MKVLILNGSPNTKGCTARALSEVETILNCLGIETETIQVGKESIRGCMGCRYCKTNQKCILKDIVNEVAEKFEQADGLLVGTPTYYAGSNGNLISLLDRLFYSTSFNKTMKVGAAVISSRRGGSTSAFDEINQVIELRIAYVTAYGENYPESYDIAINK